MPAALRGCHLVKDRVETQGLQKTLYELLRSCRFLPFSLLRVSQGGRQKEQILGPGQYCPDRKLTSSEKKQLLGWKLGT